MSRLAVANLHLTLGGTPLICDLSLAATLGMCIYLHGSNGSGKSSFLKCLKGTLQPDSGQILIDRKPIGEIPCSRLEELVPLADQDPAVEGEICAVDHLVDSLTLGEAGRWLSVSRKAARAKVVGELSQELEDLNLGSSLYKPLASLSYGQKKLLCLLRCLRIPSDSSPRILLLDEPLAGIQPYLFNNLFRLLRSRLEAGWTALVVEHRPEISALGAGPQLAFPISSTTVLG